MDTGLTILTSGLVAAVVTWLLNLWRDKHAADEARREKHRDRVVAAVADFLAADHARYVLDVELTKAWDDVQRGADEVESRPDYNRGNPPPAYKSRAESTIEEKRPLLTARTMETDQAAARVDLLDDVLGGLARKVAAAHPSPAYPPSPEPRPDKHAAALDRLKLATREVLDLANG
ncbi:hypothetical protein [Isoptericola sp. NPDC056605]|uniref:hypothetical protein n=1 Tax=Isoptericola sp. NPDC056605 TaxID=3345876 RepID=UPI0036CEA6EB